MKCSLLTVSLLISLPLLAATLEEDQAKLAAAHAREVAAKGRAEGLIKTVDGKQARITPVQGQKEYSADVARIKRSVASDEGAQHAALKEHQKAVAEYQTVLSECGLYHDIETVGDKHVLRARQQPTSPVKRTVRTVRRRALTV